MNTYPLSYCTSATCRASCNHSMWSTTGIGRLLWCTSSTACRCTKMEVHTRA